MRALLSLPKRRGFTLIEMMITLAIIALLVSIAVPSFIRLRQRSLATRIVEDARVIASAKDQWVLETYQPADAVTMIEHLQPYLRNTQHTGVDLLGHPYTLGEAMQPVLVAAETVTTLRSAIGEAKERVFWGSFYPEIGGAPGLP